MQWTLRGAHLLLQTRTKVLNNGLETFSAVGTHNFTLRPLNARLLDALHLDDHDGSSPWLGSHRTGKSKNCSITRTSAPHLLHPRRLRTDPADGRSAQPGARYLRVSKKAQADQRLDDEVSARAILFSFFKVS